MGDMNCASGPIPYHMQVWVRRRFIENDVAPGEPDKTRAVWCGLVSHPGRAWGCTCVLESGAIYRNLPPHAIAFEQNSPDIELSKCQKWDCYGFRWSACVYPYLDGQVMMVRDWDIRGEYLFSVQPVDDGWSREPEQNKEFTFIVMDDGNLVIQPTDRTLVIDNSFTNVVEWPTWLKRQTEKWSVE